MVLFEYATVAALAAEWQACWCFVGSRGGMLLLCRRVVLGLPLAAACEYMVGERNNRAYQIIDCRHYSRQWSCEPSSCSMMAEISLMLKYRAYIFAMHFICTYSSARKVLHEKYAYDIWWIILRRSPKSVMISAISPNHFCHAWQELMPILK